MFASLDQTRHDVLINHEYEQRRWLEEEPSSTLGKRGTSLRKRVSQFYGHTCGKRSPHAGAQITWLLSCLSDLWVCWSSSTSETPKRRMLQGFEERKKQNPHGNFDGKNQKRVPKRATVTPSS